MNLFGINKKDSISLIDTIPLAFARYQINYDEDDNPIDLTFVEVNNLFIQIAGHDRDYLVGKQYSQVFPELKSNLQEALQQNEQAIRKCESFELEIFISATNKWYDIFVNVLTKNTLTLLFSDCSNRKVLEADLKQSELKYKSLYDNSPIGLFRLSKDGRILSANTALLKILQLASFDELFLLVHDKVPPAGKNGIGQLIHLNGSDKIEVKELAWKSAEGNPVFLRIHSNPTIDSVGKVLYFERTIEDVTDQKIAEKQISQLNNLFIEMGIDPHKNIQTIVKKACTILNAAFSATVELDEESNHYLLRQVFNAPKGFYKNGNPKGHVCFQTTINGNDKPVIIEDLGLTDFISSDPDLNKFNLRAFLGMPVIVDGKTKGSLCVFDKIPRRFTPTEVSIIGTLAKALSLEQKRFTTEISLQKAISEATNANQAKSQFLANMSHEIRTPLNGIIGFAEMLSSQETDVRKANILRMIEDSGYQLLSIINDIFDYSRIETGNISFNNENFRVDQLINETVGFFNKSIADKGLQLVINFDRLIINELNGDVCKLKQILVNLISNAVKFTDEGSVIIVVETTKWDEHVGLKVIVEDTGIGISPDQLSRVFVEFKQLEYYLTKRIKGTGLGLSITKKLVDFLKGTITVESRQGTGSRFEVNLPFKTYAISKEIQKEEVMNEPSQKQETQGKTVKILLAEDNEANQFLIKAITKSQDWDITVVENGAEAVERYKAGHYDIILMDVQMPVMNGYDATRKIREIESEKGIHTPILALTAFAMKSDKDICIEAGMDDYISKPFKRQQFLDAISDVLMRFN